MATSSRYEYTFAQFSNDPEKVSSALARYSANGWELVSTDVTSHTMYEQPQILYLLYWRRLRATV
jgi:hypothetical protein